MIAIVKIAKQKQVDTPKIMKLDFDQSELEAIILNHINHFTLPQDYSNYQYQIDFHYTENGQFKTEIIAKSIS